MKFSSHFACHGCNGFASIRDMPNETNDTSFSGFFDGPRLPSLSSYCSAPTCGTGYPCDACRIEDGLLCDACDAPATVLVDDGTPSKLPLCGQCHRTQQAEDADARWGSWRSAYVWFQGTKFINVGTDVCRVRFAAGEGV